jgi:hypothetical protein
MRRRQFVNHLFVIGSVLAPLAIGQPTFAATAAVTGGTNGPLCNSGGYFLPTAVTVASGDTVTFSVPASDPYAGGIQINGFPQGSFVVPRGGSITTAALTANVSYQGTWPNSPGCIKGSGTITIQAASSPTAPPATPPPSSSPQPTPGTSSVKAAPPVKPTTNPTSPTPANSNTGPVIIPPATVIADAITVAGKKITSIQNLTINQSQPMALSGTTVPNGKIILTIHSVPTTATVQADASGNWSYIITGLASGSHTVEATVTDPATNQTSAQSKLLSFVIASTPVAATKPISASTSTQKQRGPALLVSIAAVILACLIAAVALVLHMRLHRMNTPATPMNVAPVPPITNVSNVEESNKESNV